MFRVRAKVCTTDFKDFYVFFHRTINVLFLFLFCFSLLLTQSILQTKICSTYFFAEDGTQKILLDEVQSSKLINS
jgi:hypothetical protein